MLKLTCLIVFSLLCLWGPFQTCQDSERNQLFFSFRPCSGLASSSPIVGNLARIPEAQVFLASPCQSPGNKLHPSKLESGVFEISGGSDVFARIFMAYWLLKSGYFKKNAINKLSLG